MNEDEIFYAVQEVNSAIVKGELVDATRKRTRQTSLDEFTAEKAILTTVKDVELLAKSNLDSKLLSELFSLEDIRKMLGDNS